MDFNLTEFAGKAGVSAPEEFVCRCDKLREYLEKYNESVNLTRITGENEFNIKHVADSLLLPMVFPELRGKALRVADIGCGAGCFSNGVKSSTGPILRERSSPKRDSATAFGIILASSATAQSFPAA
jgi:hypothetical protein